MIPPLSFDHNWLHFNPRIHGAKRLFEWCCCAVQRNESTHMDATANYCSHSNLGYYIALAYVLFSFGNQKKKKKKEMAN